MGGKRTLQRYKDFFYPACCLIAVLLVVSGCQYNYYPRVSLETVEGKKGRAHLIKAREQVLNSDFKAAMIENQKAYEFFHPELKQEAIFQKALLYAHPDNPVKDFEKSLVCFELIEKNIENTILSSNAPLVFSIIKQAREMEEAAGCNAKSVDRLKKRLEQTEKQNQSLINEQTQLKAYIAKLREQIKQLKEIDLGSIKETQEVPSDE